MDIIENIKDTISKTGKTAVKKTKDLAGIAKITAEIEETKNLIDEVYQEIGKKYCSLYDKDTAGEEFAVNVATIHSLTEHLEELRNRRLTLRGKVKCEGCGKSVNDEFTFCPHCGARLPEIPEEEDDESIEEADEGDIKVEFVDTSSDFADEDEEIDDDEE